MGSVLVDVVRTNTTITLCSTLLMFFGDNVKTFAAIRSLAKICFAYSSIYMRVQCLLLLPKYNTTILHIKSFEFGTKL